MREGEQPYCIPHKRELTHEEILILEYLLARNKKYKETISGLKVVARCGCGDCPTILFATDIEAQPSIGKFSELVSVTAKAENGTIVGVSVLERYGELSELEVWSVCGGDIDGLPSIEALG